MSMIIAAGVRPTWLVLLRGVFSLNGLATMAPGTGIRKTSGWFQDVLEITLALHSSQCPAPRKKDSYDAENQESKSNSLPHQRLIQVDNWWRRWSSIR